MNKSCDGCAFAMWRRTSAGRLHPDKTGRCNYLKEHPLNMQIPASFYWGLSSESAPRPNGGYIERGKDFYQDKTCSFWSAASSAAAQITPSALSCAAN